MSSEKISIVIPVYRVEAYIHRCVDSVLSQTYENLEIILVDDGSDDTCPSICDEYAAKDDRIKVIHKKNGGLSDARNAGMQIATGEWISFIDSDDWVEPTMYEKLLDIACSTGTQISSGGVIDEILNNDGSIDVKKNEFNGTVTITTAIKEEAIKNFLTNSWAAWGKIYKRSLFDGILFPVGEINEDEAIALHLLNKCEKVSYTNESFYHYIRRPDSITTENFSVKRLIWYKHCKDNLKWIDEHYPEFHSLALERFFSSVMYSLIQLSRASKEYKPHAEPMLQDVKLYYKDFCTVTSKNKKQRFQLFLFRYIPFGVYCNLMSMISK